MELSDKEGQILPEFVDEVSLLCEDLTKSKELPTHHQQDAQTPMEENFSVDNMTSDDDLSETNLQLDLVCSICDNGGYVLCCEGTCLRSFHQIKSEELQAKIAARDSFACPLHMCKVCNLTEDKNQYPLHFAVCRRRPTAYHRKCVPKDCYEDAVPRAWERLLPYNRILSMMLILMCILGSTMAVNASSCSEKEKKLKEENKRNYIMIGVWEGLGLLVVAYFWIRIYTKFKTQRMITRRQRLFKRNGGLLLQQQLHSNAGSVESIKIFSSKDLDNATEGFSTNRVLGQGGQGTVYKGMLLDGRIVAVKKSKAVDEHNIEQFINELVILSQINHRNIVLGCCLETELPSLVYEFVSNGDLSHLLHHSTTDTPWELRLRIATDVAGALSYMHSDASFKIYHRDIKSSNIMIDQNHRAKVSDFGISRFVTVANTHLSTGVAGTVGYLDPEYFQTGQYTQKSDVYSFGVVLIELITGEKTVTHQNRCLARNFALAVKQNRLVDVIDVRMKDHHNLEQVTAAARLARRCVRMRGTKRPRMREVSVELERIGSSEIVSPQPLVESDEEDDVLQFDIDSSDTASSSQFQTPASTFSIDIEQLLVPTEKVREVEALKISHKDPEFKARLLTSYRSLLF